MSTQRTDERANWHRIPSGVASWRADWLSRFLVCLVVSLIWPALAAAEETSFPRGPGFYFSSV